MHTFHTINNYKIVLVPINKSNAIYVQSFILSGRMNEGRKDSGISHLLEHVLTESWSKCKNNCAKYWGNKGIITNASTGDTTINYYVEGLSKYSKDILEYIINITSNPVIPPTRIQVEKKAVYEELIRDMNDPGWKIGLELANFFYSHEGLQNSNNIPLQLDNLKSIDTKILTDFCKKIYTPTNILFVVAGKFNNTSVLNIFKKNLPKNKCPGPSNMIFNFTKHIAEPKTIFIPNKNAEVAEIVIAFLSPVYPWSKECTLFKMITDILADGMLSLFMKKLRSELHLICNIHVDIDSDVTGTLTTIETTGNETNIPKIISGISNILEDMLKGNFDEGQIERVKDIYLIREDALCKNNTFWGDFYGSQYINQLYKKTPKIYTYEEFTKAIHSATKADIVRVARKIFDLRNMLIIYQCKNPIQ